MIYLINVLTIVQKKINNFFYLTPISRNILELLSKRILQIYLMYIMLSKKSIDNLNNIARILEKVTKYTQLFNFFS